MSGDALKNLASWLRKGPKVTVEPHPEDVIDVHPSVLANMQRRLAKKPAPGPRAPKKDVMDDSVHMEPKVKAVKKSEALEALADWLAKAQIGVHMPSGKNSGNSPAGQATRSHASAGPTTGRKPKDKATAVGEHKRVISELRSMKKPNLPKGAKCADDDLDKGDEFTAATPPVPVSATNMKPMSKSLMALDQWLCKAAKVVGYTSTMKPIHDSGKQYHKNFNGAEHHEAYVLHSRLSQRAGAAGNMKLASKHGQQREAHRAAFEAHETLGHKIPSFDESHEKVHEGHIVAVPKKGR